MVFASLGGQKIGVCQLRRTTERLVSPLVARMTPLRAQGARLKTQRAGVKFSGFYPKRDNTHENTVGCKK